MHAGFSRVVLRTIRIGTGGLRPFLLDMEKKGCIDFSTQFLFNETDDADVSFFFPSEVYLLFIGIN